MSRDIKNPTICLIGHEKSFVRGGPTLTMFFFFFLADGEREDPSTTIRGS